MKPVYQDKFGAPLGPDAPAPQGPLGNCWQAALASLLERPLHAVPHFAQTEGPDHPEHGPVWWVAARLWLQQQHELDLAYFDRADHPTPRSVLLEPPPPGWCCLAGGKSPRGDFGHVVVVDVDGQLVHDPRPPHLGGPYGLDGPPHGWDVLVAPYALEVAA